MWPIHLSINLACDQGWELRYPIQSFKFGRIRVYASEDMKFLIKIELKHAVSFLDSRSSHPNQGPLMDTEASGNFPALWNGNNLGVICAHAIYQIIVTKATIITPPALVFLAWRCDMPLSFWWSLAMTFHRWEVSRTVQYMCGLKKLPEQKRETKSHMRDQIVVCHIHFLTSCILTLLRCTAYPYGSLPPKRWNLDTLSIRLQFLAME